MDGEGGLNDPQMVRKKCLEDPGSGGGVLMYSELTVRLAFIRKVFLLLMLQLAVAAAFIALFTFNDGIKKFAHQNRFLVLGAMVIYGVTIIAMALCEPARRQVPCNYICALVVTLSLSFMTGALAAYFKTEVVLLAAITCCICCFIVALLATQTSLDLTPYVWAFCAAGIALLVFGIVALIARVYWNMKGLHVAYAALGCILMMGYFALDLQLIMGDKKYAMSPEDYVFAATCLFVDIIVLFQHLLALLSEVQQ